MKVAKTAQISLSGPLARNPKLNSLKVGDSVIAHVVKNLGNNSAVLDISGNRVKGNFSFPVPDEKILKLVISGKEKDTLSLKYQSESIEKNLNFETLRQNLMLTNNQLSQLGFLIKKAEGRDISFFEILLNLKFSSDKTEKKKDLFSKFNNSTDKMHIQLLKQMVLNNPGSFESSFLLGLMEILQNKKTKAFAANLSIENESTEEELFDEKDLNSIIENRNYLNNAENYYYLTSHDEECSHLELFSNGVHFMIRLDFSALKTVEIVGQASENGVVNVFLENFRLYKEFISEADSLLKLIVDASNSIVLNVYSKENLLNNLNEKKSAFEFKA